MKLTLKTDPETLFLIHRIVLEKSQNYKINKCTRSMMVELFEKLSKSCITYTTNPNGKPRTIELRYHLATELLNVVTATLINAHLGTYEHNKVEIFKNQLHQKLL